MLDATTGYLRVYDFTRDVAGELRTAIEVLKRDGATRMVLDLRDASWGDPGEAGPVAELFMDGGVVARLVGRRMSDTVMEADATRRAWEGPLVVLINNGTSGAGEIVAAALADSIQTPLVGEHTFGRAALTKSVPLPEGGLVLTVAKYMSPSGISIHGDGIEPSVRVARADESGDETEGPDRILEKSLEVLAGGEDLEAAA